MGLLCLKFKNKEENFTSDGLYCDLITQQWQQGQRSSQGEMEFLIFV